MYKINKNTVGTKTNRTLATNPNLLVSMRRDLLLNIHCIYTLSISPLAADHLRWQIVHKPQSLLKASTKIIWNNPKATQNPFSREQVPKDRLLSSSGSWLISILASRRRCLSRCLCLGFSQTVFFVRLCLNAHRALHPLNSSLTC